MITHLFFSGSHLWGFYNFGVIRYIQAFPHKFKLLKNYGGVSFGACVAFLLSMNLKIEEIENIFYEFSKDEDIKSVYFNDMFNIIDNKGIDNTSKYFKWITDYLTKINIDAYELTFMDISKKFGNNLHITCLSINSGLVELFNTENTPDTKVYKVLEATISIPIISIPVEINGFLYVDPGLLDNTIVHFFSDIPNNQILSVVHNFNSGFKKYPKNHNFTNTQYFSSLFSILIQKMQYNATHKYNNENTLVIKDHDDIIDIIIKDDSIYLKYDKDTINKAILYGFKLMNDWYNKTYIEK